MAGVGRLPGDLLTARQRAYQARLAAKVAADVAGRFSAVSATDVVGQRNFIDAAIPIIVQANRLSAASARKYAIEMSVLEGGSADEVRLADPPAIEAIRTSLRVTGPVALRQKVTRIQVDKDKPAGARAVAAAKQEAAAGAAGAAVRHALAGGRDTIEEYAEPGRGMKVRGYVRITREDDKVCYFCAMLATRANYLEDSFDYSDQLFEGAGTAKVHDSCRCILRPVYSKTLPESVLMYRRAWKAMSGGDGTAVNNFRRNWGKRTADWDEEVA